MRVTDDHAAMDQLLTAAPPSTSPTLRHSLRLVTLAWVFGAGWMFITTGAMLTRYAKTMDMPVFGFGLLAAIPYAGAIFQLPASYYLETHGRRKRLFLLAGAAHRSMWFVIAAIPWIAPQAEWWWLLLVVLSGSTLLANLQSPAWVTWMADLVPGRIRGRYFSRRTQIGQFVGLITTTIVGLTLDHSSMADPVVMRRTISIALAVAAVCGLLDVAHFRNVDEAIKPHTTEPVPFRKLVAGVLGDGNFRRFMAYTFTLTFGVGYMGQFIWLYLFDVVHMTNLQANLMLVAMPLVVSMLCYPLWGRLIDRFGCRPVMLIAGIFVVQGGAAWVFITRDNWYFGYAASLLATAAWPGVELGTTNFLLHVSNPKGQRARGGSAYVAVHSLTVAVAGTCSGLFGGQVATVLKDFHGSILGYDLTYHGVLFLSSALLRALALIWLIRLVDPRGGSARTAFRYMTANIYSNVQQAILLPGRGIVRLGKTVYRVLPRDRDADG